MSAPRTKRQFAGASSDPSQRQITAFFGKATTSSDADTAASATGPLNGPAIPAQVQANLLSVGMRVRKSVPEGYKVDPGSYSAFALWSDDTSPVAATPNAPIHASTRELSPFCGIHKVGGLAVQPLVTPADDNNMPYLSSQESTSSVTSATAAIATSAAATRKRFFITEEEEENDTSNARLPHGGPWRHRDDWIDGEISPRSFAPAGWGNARVMAMPKPRSRKLGTTNTRGNEPPSSGRGGGSGSLARLGQENMTLDDFDEAPFLEYEADMELEQ